MFLCGHAPWCGACPPTECGHSVGPQNVTFPKTKRNKLTQNVRIIFSAHHPKRKRGSRKT